MRQRLACSDEFPVLLTQCGDKAEWDRFVDASPQGSVFCHTQFLDALGLDYELWWVEGPQRRSLGAVVVKDDAGRPCWAPVAFSLYQGLLFHDEHVRRPVHSRLKEGLEAVRFLLNELESRYPHLSFCLHPEFEDLRGFSWFHYDEPERGRFQTTVSYTGLIDLRAFSAFEAYLATIRSVRRYEYRQAVERDLTIETSHDLDTLENLYRATLARQRITVEPATLRRLRSIADAALSLKFGELLLCRDGSGDAISATLFLHDDHCGYYLVGANHAESRRTGSGAFLLLENVRRCHARGLKWVDVCGMNSPERGDFKASFNAAPVPYFVVTWKGPLR